MKEQRRFNVILKIMAVIISLSIVIGCASTESVQAATKKSSGSTYYVILLNHQNGGRSANGRYWMPGTKAVRYDKNSITFYGSFSKANKFPITYSKKNFLKYGKRTFKLTSATKYYEAEIDGNYRISKATALRTCKRLNGLSVRLKVKNGKIISMTFGS